MKDGCLALNALDPSTYTYNEGSDLCVKEIMSYEKACISLIGNVYSNEVCVDGVLSYKSVC